MIDIKIHGRKLATGVWEESTFCWFLQMDNARYYLVLPA